MDTYARVLFKRKDYAKAREIVDRTLSLTDERSEEILEHAGDIYFMDGDPDGALRFGKKPSNSPLTTSSLQRKSNTRHTSSNDPPKPPPPPAAPNSRPPSDNTHSPLASSCRSGRNAAGSNTGDYSQNTGKTLSQSQLKTMLNSLSDSYGTWSDVKIPLTLRLKSPKRSASEAPSPCSATAASTSPSASSAWK